MPRMTQLREDEIRQLNLVGPKSRQILLNQPKKIILDTILIMLNDLVRSDLIDQITGEKIPLEFSDEAEAKLMKMGKSNLIDVIDRLEYEFFKLEQSNQTERGTT